jgi:ABC-type sugar transport system, auxiliary component
MPCIARRTSKSPVVYSRKIQIEIDCRRIKMKQSEINMLLKEAAECLKKHNWKLPPEPEWCATDFGLGEYEKAGLVEVLLCNEPEYCEKIMYARENMVTPCHTHYERKRTSSFATVESSSLFRIKIQKSTKQKERLKSRSIAKWKPKNRASLSNCKKVSE